MKYIKTDTKRASFKVLDTTLSAQSAMMVLQPGESTGEPQNEHPRSEQWLFVISGTGRAGEFVLSNSQGHPLAPVKEVWPSSRPSGFVPLLISGLLRL
jgi:hypothetical protein